MSHLPSVHSMSIANLGVAVYLTIFPDAGRHTVRHADIRLSSVSELILDQAARTFQAGVPSDVAGAILLVS